MAIRGQRPKPTVLRLVGGNAGRRPLPANDPMPEGAPIKPKGLRGVASQLWDERIAKAFWLTWADSEKAELWCHLAAELKKSKGKTIAARIAQFRSLGSELGFDPASRARIGGNAKPKESKDPAAEFLG